MLQLRPPMRAVPTRRGCSRPALRGTAAHRPQRAVVVDVREPMLYAPAMQLTDAFRSTPGPVLVVTGAGISLASGIPTFRGTDPGAVWKRDVTELGTVRYFEEEPEGSWSWYLSRFDSVRDAKPNPGHHALAALERWCASRSLPFL